MGKIVFLDIDGTLVDKLETIHPSTVKAVELARKKGHKLFISSGRYRNILPKCLAPLAFTDGVFASGASVICDNKQVFNSVFTAGQYDRITGVMISHKAMLVAESFENEDFLGDTYDDRFKMMRDWILSLGGRFIPRAQKGLDNIGKFVYKSADCPAKILESELGDICDIVMLSYPGDDSGGEIMQKGMNKSIGIEKVLEYYGADIEDTIAIGDGGNDIEMLSYCKVGVAMGNAPEQVKAHADIITDRIENDGLYKAFETCGLL